MLFITFMKRKLELLRPAVQAAAAQPTVVVCAAQFSAAFCAALPNTDDFIAHPTLYERSDQAGTKAAGVCQQRQLQVVSPPQHMLGVAVPVFKVQQIGVLLAHQRTPANAQIVMIKPITNPSKTGAGTCATQNSTPG
jgi:hypothetical protein